MKKSGFSGLVFLLISFCAYSQVTTKLPAPKADKYYFSAAGKDILHTATFPRYLKKEDVPFLIGGLTSTLFFLPADEAVTEAMFKNQSEALTDFCQIALDPWGNGLYTLPVFGLTWLAGSIADDDRSKWVGLQGSKATILAMAVSRVPKFIFQRHRPDENDINAYQFEGPFKGFTGNYSFPSGHAFIAFAAVSSVAPELKDKKWLVVAMYSLASAVALSRVYQTEHWLTDAVGGAVSGYVFGRFLWRLDNWKVSKSSGKDRIRLE
jgi:membrane-associated phospholipid phosphatase